MKNRNLIKHIFPGGNTTEGFKSFFDQILGQDEANRIFCIKGGPGVGKSSLMKKVGKHMEELNYFVEYYHCSSDPNSLDAIMIPDLKVALMDGTNPHIVDPKNPGVVDEIINLGLYWNEDKLIQYKDIIIKLNEEIKCQFEKAYQCFKASKEIYKIYELTEKKAILEIEYNKIRNNIINEIYENDIFLDKISKKRNFFAYGLTPIGITQYRDTVIYHVNKKYSIKESIGISSEDIMNDIVNEAMKRGLNIECYYSPIKINKIDDIILPELSISISANNKYNNCKFTYDKDYDLTKLMNLEIYDLVKDEIDQFKDLFETLLYQGLSYINKAKRLHDELENYYVENMNFKELDKLTSILIKKILIYK